MGVGEALQVDDQNFWQTPQVQLLVGLYQLLAPFTGPTLGVLQPLTLKEGLQSQGGKPLAQNTFSTTVRRLCAANKTETLCLFASASWQAVPLSFLKLQIKNTGYQLIPKPKFPFITSVAVQNTTELPYW